MQGLRGYCIVLPSCGPWLLSLLPPLCPHTPSPTPPFPVTERVAPPRALFLPCLRPCLGRAGRCCLVECRPMMMMLASTLFFVPFHYTALTIPPHPPHTHTPPHRSNVGPGRRRARGDDGCC